MLDAWNAALMPQCLLLNVEPKERATTSFGLAFTWFRGILLRTSKHPLSLQYRTQTLFIIQKKNTQ